MAPLPDFYRTRMCPSLVDTGSCPYGEKCSYAHSEQQLREGVTKTTSNAASFAHSPPAITSKAKQKPQAHAGRQTKLQQLLTCYGVPRCPAKLDIPQLPPPRMQDSGARHLPPASGNGEFAEQCLAAMVDELLGVTQKASDKTLLVPTSCDIIGEMNTTNQGFSAVQENMIRGSRELKASMSRALLDLVAESISRHDKLALAGCFDSVWTC